jgi:tRNA-splicing endonuclease subunit Sen34
MVAPEPVQISYIAGRYLVFDHRHVSRLRRRNDVCGVLVGTVPQSPTQNVFLGIPLELRAEDARLLLRSGVATIRDEMQLHLAALQGSESPLRRNYQNSIKATRQRVEKAMHGHMEARPRPSSVNVPRGRALDSSGQPRDSTEPLVSAGQHISSPSISDGMVQRTSCSITPASTGYIPSIPSYASTMTPQCNPLYRHLCGKGFFMTPGLRFGARLSVYPGDPLRYHAHYLANSYAWDDEIPLLQLVGAGRLSTAVKKGFLAGGAPSTDPQPDDQVRVFCVEWAGM